MFWWLAVPLLFLVATVVAHNGLVRSRERTREAWSGIDVQLTRRAELVPALVEVVRGYAAHERETLEAVIEARSNLTAATRPVALAGANAALSSSLGSLFGLVEAYPELRAAEGFLRLQAELSDLEEKLAYSRQFYNRNALDFNTRIQRFPTVILARVLGSEPFEFFDAEEENDEEVGDLTGRVRFPASDSERE
jgi:LemA protein